MSVGNPFDPLLQLGQDSQAELRQDFDQDVLNQSEYDSDEIEEDVDVEVEEDIEEDIEEDDSEYSEYAYDEIDDVFESQLLDAQQQWEESLQQLNKVLNWVLLPLVGKFMGRRVAKVIWQHAMEYFWR